jgi:meso-butanediol dehydrogenase/(S,S)-butanediol dehydrogenase/diacetyl reductase
VRLDDKVAIVTGGGMGIGEGIALCLAEEGADVAILDLNPDAAARVAERVEGFGRKSLAIAADCTNPAEVNQAVQKALDYFGRIDILVNNVGGEKNVGRNGDKFVDMTWEEWDDNLKLNLSATIVTCQAVVPFFVKQKSGKIVNVSSIAGRPPSGGGGEGRMGGGGALLMPYSVAKAGIIQLTRALALHLAADNINVNCICPGTVYTPLFVRGPYVRFQSNPQTSGMDSNETFEKLISPLVPLKRAQTPEDMGRAVVFFVSEDARNITGQSLNVDGGMRPN